MPDTNDAATEADFAAVLAELHAEEPSDTEGEEAEPEANVNGDPATDDESEETEEGELEGDDDALEEPDTEPAVDVSEIARLIEAGDLKGAAAKLGLDPAVFKLNSKQFTAMRKGLAEAKASKSAAETKAAEAAANSAKWESIQQQAEEIYGPIVAGSKAYRGGEHMQARAAIELIFGDKFENVVANVARAAKGLDPAQVEVIKLRKELEAEKTAKAKEQAAAQAAQTERAQDTQILGKLKGTPLEGLEEAAADIGKAVRASLDPRTGQYSLTVKEAYAKVKADYAVKAARLSKLTGKPAFSKGQGPESVKPRTPLAPVRKPVAKPATPADKKAAEEAEFAAELAAAKRETDTAARRVRRAR